MVGSFPPSPLLSQLFRPSSSPPPATLYIIAPVPLCYPPGQFGKAILVLVALVGVAAAFQRPSHTLTADYSFEQVRAVC
jgi:hypothetical protein